ncbi:uncharacterized protein BDR25DRAFT_305624 [Lindgomyces ingoldianus]|uniref:Uncharacterized protein n=1 Tax=Lindgomyces ingoldianus TaxID=673940 RepID=A0ACB6QJP6_9PLEO|nr:uncharacterized protein BDR25DRAFT_305624 [Lindgomyces ingoldianus]KAF2467169.1 hypothetical protein BDR25DRAFT_305624 [Lindgomyces ingoldianus]
MDPQAKTGTSAEKDNENSFPTPKAPLRNVADFYRRQPIYDRRIHILGVGSVGRFIAHSLRGIPNPPPITLLFHRGGLLKEWNESSKKLQLITDGSSEKQGGFDVELAIPRPRFHGKEVKPEENVQDPSTSSVSPDATHQLIDGESNEPINSLIMCVKAPNILSALSAVKHRLHPESVILFFQNGMGTVEEVSREIFPDPQTRPHYMLGINSHGMHTSPDDPFTATHAGFGTISIGIIPHERNQEPGPYSPTLQFKPGFHEPAKIPVTPKNPANPNSSMREPMPYFSRWTPNSRYLLRSLLRTPVLCATAFSPPDLLQLQLEKLAVNCIVNPLTVMLDARNGSILYNYHLTRAMRLLLSEISLVIRSMPELQYIPNVEQRFDPGRLETMVVGVANKTRDNISSMLADVRAGRRTEIEYINGWVVKRGEELGIRCFMNYMMMNLVKGKNAMIQLEMGEAVPFVETRPGEDGIKIQGETGEG